MTLQELFDDHIHHEFINKIMTRKTSRLEWKRKYIHVYVRSNKLDVEFQMRELKELLYKIQGYKKEIK